MLIRPLYLAGKISTEKFSCLLEEVKIFCSAEGKRFRAFHYIFLKPWCDMMLERFLAFPYPPMLLACAFLFFVVQNNCRCPSNINYENL